MKKVIWTVFAIATALTSVWASQAREGQGSMVIMSAKGFADGSAGSIVQSYPVRPTGR